MHLADTAARIVVAVVVMTLPKPECQPEINSNLATMLTDLFYFDGEKMSTK